MLGRKQLHRVMDPHGFQTGALVWFLTLMGCKLGQVLGTSFYPKKAVNHSCLMKIQGYSIINRLVSYWAFPNAHQYHRHGRELDCNFCALDSGFWRRTLPTVWRRCGESQETISRVCTSKSVFAAALSDRWWVFTQRLLWGSGCFPRVHVVWDAAGAIKINGVQAVHPSIQCSLVPQTSWSKTLDFFTE